MLAKTLMSAIGALGLAAVSFNAHAYATFSGIDADGSDLTRASFTNANAAQTIFLSFLQSVGTETFEGIGTGSATPMNLAFPGDGTASLTGSVSVGAWTGTGANGVGQYPHSGSQFILANATTVGVTFSDNVAAFGFFGMDIGELGGDLRIRMTTVGGATQEIDVPNVPNTPFRDGSALFFGLIAQNPSEEFTHIDLFDVVPVSGDTFVFDDMSVGSLRQICERGCTVSEPSMAVLLGLGLVGLVASRRRKGPK